MLCVPQNIDNADVTYCVALLPVSEEVLTTMPMEMHPWSGVNLTAFDIRLPKTSPSFFESMSTVMLSYRAGGLKVKRICFAMAGNSWSFKVAFRNSTRGVGAMLSTIMPASIFSNVNRLLTTYILCDRADWLCLR